MFCPQCGQERVSDATNYCSRCGFLLTGAAQLLQTGGAIPGSEITAPVGQSPRKRGLKQGLFIFLLTFLVVPIVAMLSQFSGLRPTLAGVAAVALFMGGILRMVYALMFEEASQQVRANMPPAMEGSQRPQQALPPQMNYPIDQYRQPATGNWRDTNELPPSVTEGTTRLLEKEEQPR